MRQEPQRDLQGEVVRLNVGIWIVSLWVWKWQWVWFRDCREIAFDYLAEYKPPKKRGKR